MANEVTVPLLPCRSIDEIGAFYEMLGFAVTYRQTRPNPYICVRREDLQLHFFGMDDFDPEQSYGSCLVFVPDTAALFDSFAAAMRAAHGKLLVAGIPRMTRPRKRKNAGNNPGFSVIDPGGNWIRIFRATDPAEEAEDADPAEEPAGKLARTLQNAIVLGESKGDHRQAARILDSGLRNRDERTEPTDLARAMTYRAELALVLREDDRAGALLAELRDLPLDDADRERLADTLADADELWDQLSSS